MLVARLDERLPLFLQSDKAGRFPHDASQYDHLRRRLLYRVALLAFAIVFSASYYFHYGRRFWYLNSPREIMSTDIGLPKEVQQAWAAHSPYFSAAEYIPPPARCEVVQVFALPF